MPDDPQTPPRDESGRFVKGHKRGRPKGAKNKITLLKEAESKRLAKLSQGKLALNLDRVTDVILEVALDKEHRHWPLAAKMAAGPLLDAVRENQGGGMQVVVNVVGVRPDEARRKDPIEGECAEAAPDVVHPAWRPGSAGSSGA
jgi:hypothetical protein